MLEASDGKLNEPWPAQLNKLMVQGGHDLVLSIGQVVPHEVLVSEVKSFLLQALAICLCVGVGIGRSR